MKVAARLDDSRHSHAAAAIDGGISYLASRIRSHELVTRAPDDSPNKRFDDWGEPFLAVDALIAVGERIAGEDRRDLKARLLASQREGAWSYADWGGIDADTTASALRALDRLGHPVSLTGLKAFFNPESGLYDTFPSVRRAAGLHLPPQAREKHLGAHPCVLANVYLLLHERGELGGVSHDLLRRLQTPDGHWFSYFYTSPFYSTRLFTEVLTALGEEYDVYMRATLDGLLACAPPASPTQAAEVLICLHLLRERDLGDRRSIGDKAAGLLHEILAAQRPDGSWPGEVIWMYVERVISGLAVGFDHYRVRSTALCVRALELWS